MALWALLLAICLHTFDHRMKAYTAQIVMQDDQVIDTHQPEERTDEGVLTTLLTNAMPELLLF